MRGRGIPLLPRSVGVALVVGFVAFVAGTQLAPSQGRGTTVTETRPDPTDPATATVLATPGVVLGRSPFRDGVQSPREVAGRGAVELRRQR